MKTKQESKGKKPAIETRSMRPVTTAEMHKVRGGLSWVMYCSGYKLVWMQQKGL